MNANSSRRQQSQQLETEEWTVRNRNTSQYWQMHYKHKLWWIDLNKRRDEISKSWVQIVVATKAPFEKKPEEKHGTARILQRYLGPILQPFFGQVWGYLGLSEAILGPSWGHLGAFWGLLGPSWGHLGAKSFLEPCVLICLYATFAKLSDFGVRFGI